MQRIKLLTMLDGTQTTCEDLPNCHHCDFCCEPQSPLIDTLEAIMLNPPPPPPATTQLLGLIAALEKEPSDDEFPDTSGINWGSGGDFGDALHATQTPPVQRDDAAALANPLPHLTPPTTMVPSMPVLMAGTLQCPPIPVRLWSFWWNPVESSGMGPDSSGFHRIAD